MWNPFRRKKLQEESVFGQYQYPDNYQLPEEVEAMEREAQTAGESSTGEGLLVAEESVSEEPIGEEFVLVEDNLTNGLKKTTRGLLLALVVLVPLFLLTLTAPGDVLSISKQALIYGFVILSLILWLAIIVRQGGVALKRSGFEIGILAVLGAWLMAALFSSQVYLSFVASNGLISLAGLALFLFLFLNFFAAKDIPKIIDYFLLGSFLAILGGILGLFGVPIFSWLTLVTKGITVGGQFNSVGSVNVLAGLASLAFILAAGRLFQFQDQEYPRLLGYLNILTLIASVLLLLIVNWWVYYLVLAVGMAAIVLTPGVIEKLSGVKVKLKAISLIIPLAILTLSLLMILGARYFSFNFYGRSNLPAEVSLSQGTSLGIVKKVIYEKPIFGYGPGNFYLAYDKYKPAAINSTNFWSVRFNNATSEILTIPVTTGLVGLGAMLFFLGLILKEIWQGLKKAAIQSGQSQLWLIIPSFLGSLLLLFLYPLANVVLFFSFWLLLTLLTVALSNDRDELKVPINSSSLQSISASLAFVLILIFGLAGGYILFRKYQAEYYFAQAQRLNINNSTVSDQAVGLMRSAVAAGNDVKFLAGLSQALLGRMNFELNNKTDQPETVAKKLESLNQEVIRTTNRMADDYKNDAAAWSNAGFVYQSLIQLVTGADKAAVSAYQEALKRAPGDPDLYVRLGNVYLNRADRNLTALNDARNRRLNIKNENEVVNLIISDYKNAEGSFKKAAELKNDLAQSLYNLGVIYERQGRVKEAIKQLELTRAGNLNNPGLAFELGLLYYRDGQKQNAFNEMARAVALFKDYSNARWYLALMFEEAGQIKDAIGQLKEILKLDVNKDNPTVLEKLASLEAGQREIPPAKVTSKQPISGKIPAQR